MVAEGIHQITIAEIVGSNVSRARIARGWDAQRLADEATMVDLAWDAACIGAIEDGTHELTVTEYVSLAVLLGIAPPLLLYPPAGTAVAFGAPVHLDERQPGFEEEAILYAESHLAAEEFARWLWAPDSHALSTAKVVEDTQLQRACGNGD